MKTTTKHQTEWRCDEERALDKWEAVQWARKIGDCNNVVYLDTETTGLYDAYPVEIAILSRYGSPLLNTLVKPPVPVEPEALFIHGITPQMLEDAPTFSEIYLQLQKVLSDRHVVIYNAAFDNKILNNACLYYDLPKLNYQFSCAMRWYADYFGEWNSYYGNYKWQKLPGAGHRALDDTRACRELVKSMALPPYCQVEYSRMFPPRQLFCNWEEVVKIQIAWKDKDGWYSLKSSKEIKFYLPKFWWKHD